MIDNLLGDNDDDDGATADGPDDEEMDGLFDDPGDGGLGGEDSDDDLMAGGGDALGGDGDSMDGADLGGDDAALDGGGGGGDAANDAVSNRVDELENEVASLSSTVDTVKTENEQIRDSVEDVEENIRKLLEVYEMVTRGVNPFVDEDELGADAGGGGAAGGDSAGMGLFGDDEDEADEDDAAADIDDSIAEADADDFFDDDIEEDDDADDLDALEDVDDGELDEGFDEEPEDESGDELEDESGELTDDVEMDDGGGKSFEELKSEYESGEAGWGDEGDTSESGEADSTADVDAVDDDSEGTGDSGSDVAEDESSPQGSGVADGEKPYLGELPAGYVAETVVMDWLEYLVDEAGVPGAARTVAYYQAIDWVSESAAERLQTFLQGFGEGVEGDPEPRSPLTVDHHDESLRFIARIVSPSMGAVAFDDRTERPAWSVGNGSGDAPGDRTDRPSTSDYGATWQPRSGDVSLGRKMESDGGLRQSAVGGSERPVAGSKGGENREFRRGTNARDDETTATDGADSPERFPEATGDVGFVWHGERE